MSALKFLTTDVFTTKKFRGNPLAIVTLPTSTTLSQTQKQLIAKEFNYSETVFLHPCTQSSDGTPTWRIDIFTTTTELPFAGHPTIGTACHVLGNLSGAAGKRKGRFQVKAGIIELEFEDGVAKASIPHATHIHTATSLTGDVLLEWQKGLRKHYHVDGGALETALVSPVRGMNFATTQLRNLEELAALTTPGMRLDASLDTDWNVGPLFAIFYVDLGVEDGVRKLRTRMIEGKTEDSATGSASCGLAAYLAMKDGVVDGNRKFEMVQGVEMGRESVIGVEIKLEGGVVQEVVLEGRAVEVMEGSLQFE